MKKPAVAMLIVMLCIFAACGAEAYTTGTVEYTPNEYAPVDDTPEVYSPEAYAHGFYFDDYVATILVDGVSTHVVLMDDLLPDIHFIRVDTLERLLDGAVDLSPLNTFAWAGFFYGNAAWLMSVTIPVRGEATDIIVLRTNEAPHLILTDIAYIFDIQVVHNTERNEFLIDTNKPNDGHTLYQPAGTVYLRSDDGDLLDTFFFTLDGTRQFVDIDAALYRGRMYVCNAQFAFAMGDMLFAEPGNIDLFTLTERDGLLTFFMRDRPRIDLFTGHARPQQLPALDEAGGGTRSAFMRLEDVIATGVTHHTRDMFNRRVLADLLYSHSAAFTLAWVPVNVRPLDGFRNDVRDYSLYNLEFVFTMDYLISRGAQLGVHGYTHQRGNANSVVGYDFGAGVSEAEARLNFANQLAAAEYFGWTVYSFTFPKHLGTTEQFYLAGEYFDFVMPNFDVRGSNTPRHVHVGDRVVTYMSSVEDHLVDRGEQPILALLGRINRAGDIASFFFHTWLEYEFIHVTRDAGRLIVEHDAQSPMHRILENLRVNDRVLRPTTFF